MQCEDELKSLQQLGGGGRITFLHLSLPVAFLVLSGCLGILVLVLPAERWASFIPLYYTLPDTGPVSGAEWWQGRKSIKAVGV